MRPDHKQGEHRRPARPRHDRARQTRFPLDRTVWSMRDLHRRSDNRYFGVTTWCHGPVRWPSRRKRAERTVKQERAEQLALDQDILYAIGRKILISPSNVDAVTWVDKWPAKAPMTLVRPAGCSKPTSGKCGASDGCGDVRSGRTDVNHPRPTPRCSWMLPTTSIRRGYIPSV